MKFLQQFLSAVCCSTDTTKLTSWFDSTDEIYGFNEIRIALPQRLNEKYTASPPLTQREYYDTPLNLALHTGSHLSVVSMIPSFFVSLVSNNNNISAFLFGNEVDLLIFST